MSKKEKKKQSKSPRKSKRSTEQSEEQSGQPTTDSVVHQVSDDGPDQGSRIESTSRSLQDSPEITVETVEDAPTTPIGRILKARMHSFATPINLRKFLLPNEDHLSSKRVIYFDEWQIFFGFFVMVIAIMILAIWQLLLPTMVLVLVGILLILTGYASEELHITNYRILLRRMNWVDRLFRIPKDSQYLLEEIVAFDIQRAPINTALLIAGLLPFFLLLLPAVRSSTILWLMIVLIACFLLVLSQRLGKRSINFLMSGGHQVILGQYKGIPGSVVETFTNIIMEKNIFQSEIA